MAEPRCTTPELPTSGADQAELPAAPTRAARIHRDPLTLIAVFAIACFALIGIGGPLLGHGVFAGTDELTGLAPYAGEGLHNGSVQNFYVDDTWDSGIPNTLLFAAALKAGEIAAWNPYAVGGSPLGAVPTTATLSPVTWPYYLLPGYLAPGYLKLTEILLAVLGCALFLRRLDVGRPAALVGGLVFASSAFLVAWTNWPQTRVAAVVPFLFWGLERLVQQRKIRDAALVSLAVAAMLLGGFPAVTGYALLLGGGYLLVRVLAEYGRQWRRAVAVLAGGAAGVLGGIALSAVQLVPFLAFMGGSYVSGRAQNPDDHISPVSLVTSIAPWALGSTRENWQPYWYLPVNMVESLSYVGAAALVLVIVAIATPRAAWAVLPRGAWAFLVVATLGTAVVIYGGGAPLAALQDLPELFSSNFVGRARSVLGFLVAVLAGVGLDVLLRARPQSRRTPGAARWVALGFGVLVWASAAVFGGWVLSGANRAAMDADTHADDGVDRVAHLYQQVAGGLGFLAAGLLCAAVLWWLTRSAGAGGSGAGWGRRSLRFTAAALLPLLVAAQALTLVRPFWPRVDRASFFPVTATHTFLRDHLGHDRFAGTWKALGMGSDTELGLRALTGHTFVDKRLGELVRRVPGASTLYPTHVNFGVAPDTAASPVLDRLATRYFVTAPQDPVLGLPRPITVDGTTLLRPGEPVTVPVPGTGPVRAVGITPAVAPGNTAVPDPAQADGAPLEVAGAPQDRIEVTVRGADGRVVATNGRTDAGAPLGQPFLVPVAAENVAPSEALTATFTLRAGLPLPVHAVGGVPAVPTIGSAPDGLRIGYAGSAVIYERLTALPRIRWASSTVVQPDAAQRLDLLSTPGALRADQVLLDSPGPGADGAQARVDIRDDGLDEIAVDVDAAGAGYLVVADALQNGWAATVDGHPAALVPADHALVAVAVPQGRHDVRLHYAAPQHNAGAAVTGVALVALFGLVGTERLRERRRESQRVVKP